MVSRWTAAPPTRIQGIYYVLTGIWPILSMRTFEAISGPKVDRWLVKTMGALITVVGLALFRSSSPASDTPRTLGLGACVALGASDIIYVARGRISRIYLLDAVAETVLAAQWLRTKAQ